MESGEEKSGTLKRQRDPLSDSDDNSQPASELMDGQKRRRVEAAGRENRSSNPSSARLVEAKTKPDTPIVPSVRSLVQQLSQRGDGAVLRCLSDPGSDDRGFKEHLLGERVFNQRLERFKVPVFPGTSSSSPSLSKACPLTRSDFVNVIQQKLKGATTPSSKQASRLRQEREQELNQLQFQPISENAWLKRSSSDPSFSQDDGDAERNDGSFTEVLTPAAAVQTSDVELSTNEQNTSEIIDQMFGEVLEYAQQMEQEEEQTEDQDSGIETFSAPKEKKDEEEGRAQEEEENNGEELLTFPPSGILSPLSKSIEAAVTPLRLTVSQESSNPPSLLLSPEESTAPLPESAPLYSVDAYRTQRQKKPPSVQSVTPGAQRPANKPRTNFNSKERIAALNEEAAKLQTVISQTLQALSCCTDEEHGRGSLEEAEAEKLLLVSCEKRSALLAEVGRLREERSSAGGGSAGEGPNASQQACRGTISITNIQLPLKVEFVCSSHSRAGRPSHYFFVLIRYGPCNVVATPLATTADAQNGDTISFPTSVTLKDIRPSFEIDVEIYSLSNTSGSSGSIDRASTKSRVTPRKLLSTITRSSHTLTTAAPPALSTRRSSNFTLVGSHKITLASLGQSKFPLDKMKLEGKIRRLLGDEFQEKVPFLSPLEGNIYLQLDSRSHSSVEHRGFLTMFELISGFGVWNRQYFVLEGCELSYWNHPNDRETKEAEGSLSLSSSPSLCVRTVQRDSCARPFTFELVSSVQQQNEGGSSSEEASQKRWFSADTKQEKQDWMEKLSQALLDFHTWNRAPAESQKASSSGNLRESIL
ncbi:anillin-like [Salarias fasciatus]|uniref:anillin-like n=1 Tax=Salarias fasciatus TaxID=181472 RepID=UPI001176B3FF|nr:anillin-like [Salarias fasciatus]